ncbi:MAG: sensor histidine kinase [Anaerolineaceae bacterium]
MKPLLSRLRIQLVSLYLVVGIILALGISTGTYTLVNYYFRVNNDQALRLKMGVEFAAFHLPMPVDLYDALNQANLLNSAQNTHPSIEPDDHDSDNITPQSTPGSLQPGGDDGISVDRVEISEIADIVALPLTIEGTPITGTVVTNSWLPASKEAVAAAIVNGYDYRTIKLDDGTPVRLLTYRVPITSEIGVIQVGRSLKNQQAMLGQLINGILIIAGVCLLFLAIMSWLLAGRSIRPTQLAWERQQTFVANASHELRAPLTLIHAGVEIAQRNSESPEQKQLLDDVLGDANYMTKLIESLLLLSRLDAHKLALEVQTISLPELFAEIVRQNERVLTDKQIQIEQHTPAISVIADPVRLKQILLIFIDNAVRNNHPQGWVKLTALTKLNKVWIEVSDNGCGIPANHLNKIFDRFYKVSDRSTPDYRGSGLGLSIAKGLIEALGGEILVTSEEGKGTQVNFSLPLAK